MLDNEERTGYIRLIISGVIFFSSFFGLLLFNISPHLCGAGFICSAFWAFLGHLRLSVFYPLDDKECRPIIAVLVIIDLIQLVGGSIFGALLLFDWI